MKDKNIFIEGLPGAGKSALLNQMWRENRERKYYREGDLSPVELSWCSYMDEASWQQTLDRFPESESEIRAKSMKEGDHYVTAYTLILADRRDFYEHMEQYEIYNGKVTYERFKEIILNRYAAFSDSGCVFESSLFQYAVTTMILFYQMSDEEILEFYKEVFAILIDKQIQLIYLDVEDVKENLLRIRKERCDNQGNEMWYPLMMNFLKESPYGKENNCQGFEDLVKYFQRRRDLERRIVKELSVPQV